MLKFYANKPSRETSGLPGSIRLKIGIKYMVTTNIDVEDGLVNGACGTLKYIRFDGSVESPSPKVLFMEFAASNIGRKMRRQHEPLMKSDKNISLNWVPLRKLDKSIQTAQTAYEVFRQQFPVTPAEAVTIHKSQGQTYDSVCINIASKGLTRQKLYVACSRVTALSGLYLVGKFKPPNQPKPGDKAINAITVLKSQKRLQLSFNDLAFKAGPTIAYHNVRSYEKNRKHIENDCWYIRCDLFIFAETLTKHKQNIDLPNYDVLFRFDCNNKRWPGLGIAVFVKKSTAGIRLLETKNLTENSNGQKHLYLISLQIDDYYVITGYKSPKYPVKTFVDNIKSFIKNILKNVPSAKLILMGDFNIDSTQLTTQLQPFKSQLNPNDPTMLTNTNQIDVIFAIFDGLVCGTYWSYFSDHVPIFCMFNKDNIPMELFESSWSDQHEPQISVINQKIEKAVENEPVPKASYWLRKRKPSVPSYPNRAAVPNKGQKLPAIRKTMEPPVQATMKPPVQVSNRTAAPEKDAQKHIAVYRTMKIDRNIQEIADPGQAELVAIIDLTDSVDMANARAAIEAVQRNYVEERAASIQEIRTRNDYLRDEHIELFLNSVNANHDFQMQTTLYAQNKAMYKKMSRNVDDIQILYVGNVGPNEIGHYICIHYRSMNRTLYVSDPMASRECLNDYMDVVRRRYPYALEIEFRRAKTLQPDFVSCGVFACAYATTIVLNKDPSTYPLKLDPEVAALREHLASMLEENELRLYPT